MKFEFQNSLLGKLTPRDLAVFAPELQRVDLVPKATVLTPDAPIGFVYFPENCVCSVLATTASEKPIEVGMFGFEGMSNFVVRPGDKSYFRTVVLFGGQAWRVSADRFSQGLLTLPSLNEVALRYKDAAAIQFGFTAFANGVFAIEERLARWLLMAQDRTSGDAVKIIHDTLAAMLSVRRSGITTALHVLEGERAVKADRGVPTIRDRAKLEEIAGESYGAPEKAYRELMDYKAC